MLAVCVLTIITVTKVVLYLLQVNDVGRGPVPLETIFLAGMYSDDLHSIGVGRDRLGLPFHVFVRGLCNRVVNRHDML